MKKLLLMACVAGCAVVAEAAKAAPGAAQGPVECRSVAKMESRNATPGRGDGPFGDYWWANRFLSRIEQARAFKGQTVDLVLVGDSIMHFWEWRHPQSWAKFTAGRKVLNCGYGGDRTQNVIWRIDHGELDGYEAKNVVLMIGTNNNSSKTTKPENVAKGVETIIARIRARQPKARIILHPIFPRGVSAQSRHAEARGRNDQTNALLKKYVEAHPEIVWVDFNEKLVDASGWVPRAMMADEIHPTDAGYEVWMEALAPVLAK
ncbi:MAG: GDSL-type esterase/lipase family protein [Kiritimatiellia bacterium]